MVVRYKYNIMSNSENETHLDINEILMDYVTYEISGNQSMNKLLKESQYNLK
jgi:hypothetical protein